MGDRRLAFEQYIQVPVPQIYLSFTNATALREWLSDVATVDPKLGGRIYLAWNSGYFSSGEYVELEPGCRVEFTWCGKGDPGCSRVIISIERRTGVALRLEHILPEGEEWAKTVAESKKDGVTAWRTWLPA